MKLFVHWTAVIILLIAAPARAVESPISDASTECMDCHASIHPGIVEGWQQSRHSLVTPEKAIAVKGLERKVSSRIIPEEMKRYVVGCAECHTMRPDSHADTFEHNGYDVHVVVSPDDCRTCHSEEADQYAKNLMSHAYGNLEGNPVYQDLERTIIGSVTVDEKKIAYQPPDKHTEAESCLYCHGTKLRVTGLETRDSYFGEMEFPSIEGWPNQGVGRVNLDKSRGSCAACHVRHSFSIETARKPSTCRECHIGPDVPVYKVYSASKHGNIYDAQHAKWDFSAVPWTVGQDFRAPTCATCHVSLLVSPEGEVIGKRTHQINDRLAWRIFGLIYAHPHPEDPDTTKIRNKDGLPLPTDLDGGYAGDFLISKEEQMKRTQTMQSICKSCHSTSWVEGHWQRYENTVKETNEKIRAGTKVMKEIWRLELAQGLSGGGSIFDESLEKKWMNTWLFYANSIRFASAMAGGGDYGVFADGRYSLSKGISDLHESLKLYRHTMLPKGNGKQDTGGAP